MTKQTEMTSPHPSPLLPHLFIVFPVFGLFCSILQYCVVCEAQT